MPLELTTTCFLFDLSQTGPGPGKLREQIEAALNSMDQAQVVYDKDICFYPPRAGNPKPMLLIAVKGIPRA